VRRLIAGSTAFLAVTGTLLTLPVYAAPLPEAHPVAPSIDEVALGSVVDPVGDAVVATDGEVQPGGVDESVATSTAPPSTPPQTTPPQTTPPQTTPPQTTPPQTTPPQTTPPQTTPPQTTAPRTTAPTDVPVSGEELAGVPALTVSRAATEDFSSVGVTWQDDPAVTDVVVQLRVQALNGSWGEWTTLESDDVEQSPDAAGGADVRAGTAPYWTGEAQGVEVVVQGAGGAVPEDVRVALIDPGTSAADQLTTAGQPTATAHAASTAPRIFTRAEWGADESIRTWDPEYASTIKAATVHHTADSNNYSAAQVPAILRSMYAYHAKTRGWGDIGYNVIVDKFGRIFEGRYGGLESTVIGAHAGGFNSYTFGVSMLGNYDLVAVPQATVDAVGDVIAWKFGQYGVDPRGTTVLTSGGGGTARYAAGTKVTLPTIFGHRDVGSTACPGVYGYARLGEIRNRVAALVVDTASPIEHRYDSEPALRTSLGAPVGAEQHGNGYAWQQYAKGRLYWSAATGVHLVRGDILTAYLAAGGPVALGTPSTDEATAGRWGAYNQFARDAAIYWTADTGAQLVRGAIRAHWSTMGAEWNLGFPTSGEKSVSGGVQQTFGNGAIYWSAATGAHELRGGLAVAWSAAGGAATLGLPTSGELGVPGGAVQHFSRSYTVTWTPGGTHVLFGGIRQAWLDKGGATGVLGMPQTDEADTPEKGGSHVRFSGGSIVWAGSAGAVVLSGPIGNRWKAAGGVTSGLGLPRGAEHTTADGSARVVSFATGAAIYATQAYGAHLVFGGIGARWTAMGGIPGLGVPVADETSLGTRVGVYQQYARGKIIWTATTGAHPVYGAIGQAYDSLGAEYSRLGVPTSAEYAVAQGVRQDYQRGSITFGNTGAVTVAYR
jgi:uncharacterized protein with LGFP repeats